MFSVGTPGSVDSGVVLVVVDGLVLVSVLVFVIGSLFLMFVVVLMNFCVYGTVSLASVSSTITSISTSCTTLL